MAITKIVSVLAVLLLAVGSWLLAAPLVSSQARVLCAQMAIASDLPLVEQTPQLAGALDWQPLDQQVLAGWHGPYWLRWKLSLPSKQNAELGVHLTLRAASQAYWNGRPLMSNGVVGRSAGDEKVGQIDSVRALASVSATGNNELIVLASSHHQRFRFHNAGADIKVAPLQQLHAQAFRPWLVATLAMGVLLAAGLFFLQAHRGRRFTQGAWLLLALGGVGLALPVIEGWRPLWGYAYPWHGPRLLILLLLHFLAAILMPAYLLQRFAVMVPIIAKASYLLLILAIAAFLPSFDGRGAGMLLLSLSASIYLLLQGNGERDQRWPIVGLLIAGLLALLGMGAAFLDGPYFLLLAVLMGFFLVQHGAYLQALDRQYARLCEERNRLSLQLLRRAIQPHWLMNTLTSLQELIEQSPVRANRLVESLAEQFDRLREYSKYSSISLDEELALCRSYLDVVSVASGYVINFEVDVVENGPAMPPGVLHALVENALTHAGSRACSECPFRLHVYRQQHGWVFELWSALGSGRQSGTGTGTRFIEASLAAAYPSCWVFLQHAQGADWYARIEVSCAS